MKLKIIIDTHIKVNMKKISMACRKTLKDEFTKSNPDFWKKKNMGFWLGDTPQYIKSYTISQPFLVLPRGSLNKIESILNEHDYEIGKIFDRTVICNDIRMNLKKKLYDYQNEPANALVKHGNGIIRGPCGSGKTVILIGAMVTLQQPTLIIVHTKELARQWKARISEFTGIVPGNIGGGKRINIRPITVATQQTIWKMKNPKWLNSFGCVIGDEIHHWAARTFQITASMLPAKYRIGASADERRKDNKEFLIYETFGPCLYTITQDELIDIGKQLPVHMEVIRSKYTNEDYLLSIDNGESPDWVTMITELCRDNDRNDLILENVKRVLQNENNRVLILSDRVEHCKFLRSLIRMSGNNCGLMIGSPKHVKELEESIDNLRAGKIRVGVGTKLADEGLDIPQLTHVFCTCPVHNNTKRLNQMIGRAARVCGDKKEATIVYIWDHNIWPNIIDGEDSYSKNVREQKFLKRTLQKVCHTLEVIE